MFDDDLRMRAKRLASGERRQDDLNRLYQDLRFRALDRRAFQDIANFLAHRQERDVGEVCRASRSAAISFSVFMSHNLQQLPTLDDAIQAARSNLDAMSAADIQRSLGMKRKEAENRLRTVIACYRDGSDLPDDHIHVWTYLQKRWSTRPAFTAEGLAEDFAFVLERNSIIGTRDVVRIIEAKDFLALHAITVMHGSRVQYAEGRKAQLFACCDNMLRHLTIRADIRHEVMGVDVGSPAIMFQTTMDAVRYCTKDLLAYAESNSLRFDIPIDLRSDMRLDLYGFSQDTLFRKTIAISAK